MDFRYLRDPLFLACFAAYFVHRGLAYAGASTTFLRSYLNDLICVPFWVPILLTLERRLEVRRHDGPPSPLEVAIPVVVWSLVFEAILPAIPIWEGLAVPDPNDVLCYALGGAVAFHYWNWRHRDRRDNVHMP